MIAVLQLVIAVHQDNNKAAYKCYTGKETIKIDKCSKNVKRT